MTQDDRMAHSYNGWEASPKPDAINIQRFRVPIKDADIFLTCRAEVAPVLLNLAADFHKVVARLDNYKPTDDWGYAYRPPRGQNMDTERLSCHASGTAIDLNATQFPMHVRRMTAKQRAAANALARKYQVITWGGSWSGNSVDEMHWEISRGVTLDDVRRVIRNLRLTVDGVVEVKPPKYPNAPLKRGDTGKEVKWVQRELNQRGASLVVDGVFGAKTGNAVRAFRARRPALFPLRAVVDRRTWAALFGTRES